MPFRPLQSGQTNTLQPVLSMESTLSLAMDILVHIRSCEESFQPGTATNASGKIMWQDVLNKQKKGSKQVLLPIVVRSDIEFFRTAQNGSPNRYFRVPLQGNGNYYHPGWTQCNMPQVNKFFRQTMKMEAEHSSEMLVHIFQPTRRHCREDRKPDSRRVPNSFRIAFV
jgi:hypothetical protein